jgi:quinol-cytochrome oxidoreductase complex cytochrome b subunit
MGEPHTLEGLTNTMDWNRGALLLAQCVVVVVLGVCVAMGHNSVITDALLAVSGSIAGVGLFQTVKGKPKQ